MGEIDVKVKMMSAVTETLRYKEENPKLDYEKIMQHISDFVKKENNQKIQISMIAAASKTLFIREKEPRLKDKEIMKKVIDKIPEILEKIE